MKQVTARLTTTIRKGWTDTGKQFEDNIISLVVRTDDGPTHMVGRDVFVEIPIDRFVRLLSSEVATKLRDALITKYPLDAHEEEK